MCLFLNVGQLSKRRRDTRAGNSTTRSIESKPSNDRESAFVNRTKTYIVTDEREVEHWRRRQSQGGNRDKFECENRSILGGCDLTIMIIVRCAVVVQVQSNVWSAVDADANLRRDLWPRNYILSRSIDRFGCALTLCFRLLLVYADTIGVGWLQRLRVCLRSNRYQHTYEKNVV